MQAQKVLKKNYFILKNNVKFFIIIIIYWFYIVNNQIIKIKFERLSGSFAGTGDAFAAQVLAWLTILKDLKVFYII
jgi:hypothetical protein